MILTSEIIQTNLIILEKALIAFPKLKLYQTILSQKDELVRTGNLFTTEYYRLDSQLNNLREECRSYKLNPYLDFIEFIGSTKKFEQEVFYKKKIKNLHFGEILSKYAVDDDAKKTLSNKTKSTFTKFINSKKFEIYKGDYRPRYNRTSKRYSDNLYKTGAIIANYCIQNEIDINDSSRIKDFYTKLLPTPDLKISQEIEKTSSIIDFIINKFRENDSDFRKINLDHMMVSIKNELRTKMLSLSTNENIKCIEVPEAETTELTLNKVYQVLDTRLEYGSLKVSIKNDLDREKYYFYRNFETISILRDSFIDDILSDDE